MTSFIVSHSRNIMNLQTIGKFRLRITEQSTTTVFKYCLINSPILVGEADTDKVQSENCPLTSIMASMCPHSHISHMHTYHMLKNLHTVRNQSINSLICLLWIISVRLKEILYYCERNVSVLLEQTEPEKYIPFMNISCSIIWFQINTFIIHFISFTKLLLIC